MKEGTLKEAKRIGVKVDIYSVSTEGDIQAQLNLLETMIQKKYDGLAVAPITPVNLISGIVKATKLGIPVVNLDEAVNKKALEEAGGKIISFVTTDNFKVGEQAAAYVVKMLGKSGGEVAIIEPLAGQGFELQAIASTIIGGTSFFGGEGSVFGTVMGALIIGVINNALNILNVQTYWQQVVTGLIIIGAVLLNQYFKRR